MPTGPNGKNLPWKFDVLPAIPRTFELQPIEQSEGRLKHVLKLARRKDIDLIVNACDAGREGELIFQYILDIGLITKPVKRLWMQSMTTGAIQEAWDQLREGDEMNDLADAAKCRSESDWLVGLNSTRALTCFRSRHGGFNITAAGRVQTPTLAILAKREKEIQAFEPTPYAEVHADFGVTAGSYPGRWIDLGWKKEEGNPHSRAERIWDKDKAETIRARCAGKTGTVHEEKRPPKADCSPALRSHHPATRSPLHGPKHPRPGTGTLRASQDGDLSADRFEVSTGGLPYECNPDHQRSGKVKPANREMGRGLDRQ